MGIPILNADGLLPPGIHRLTVDEFEAMFVDGMNDTEHRRRIFKRWRLHRAHLQNLVPISHQWIDGSFVTAKPKPADIDVVTFFDGSDFDVLPPMEKDMFQGLLDGSSTRARWTVDSYGVARMSGSDAERRAYDIATGYWKKQWSSVRDQPALRKGFVEVIA